MTTSAAVLAALKDQPYINLETFKKSGAGVKTPIWFAESGGKLYFFTNRESWKVKRLARNSACRFAVCGVRGAIKGDWFDGTCERLEGDEADVAYRALRKKYGMQMLVADVGSKIVGTNAKRAFYRIDA